MSIHPGAKRHLPIYPEQDHFFLGTGHAGSDYLDLIVRRGRDSEALHAIGEFVADERQTLMLEHVPESSLAAGVARRLEDYGWTTSIVPPISSR